MSGRLGYKELRDMGKGQAFGIPFVQGSRSVQSVSGFSKCTHTSQELLESSKRRIAHPPLCGQHEAKFFAFCGHEVRQIFCLDG